MKKPKMAVYLMSLLVELDMINSLMADRYELFIINDGAALFANRLSMLNRSEAGKIFQRLNIINS